MQIKLITFVMLTLDLPPCLVGERAPGRWVRGLQAGIKRGCGGCLGEIGERCGCPGEKPARKEGVQQSARKAGACGSPD